MRFKGQHPPWQALLKSKVASGLDDGLVTPVDAIEIANGNTAPLMDLQNILYVPINFHWRGKCLSWNMGSRSKDLYIQ